MLLSRIHERFERFNQVEFGAAVWHHRWMHVWTLKPGLEKKFSAGHPWVFSSDLAHSPKGISLGEAVELRDAGGRFLARGYGHPNTLISFRVLTREANESLDAAFWFKRLKSASDLRRRCGVFPWSHRLCFAEGDSIPGLVIDRYRLDPRSFNGQPAQVFVVQSSTAGMDRALPDVLAAVETLVNAEAGPGQPTWENTAIVVANDSKSREMEGVPVQGKRFERPLAGLDASRAKILIEPPVPDLEPTVFTVDLITGQKTGFFLDQRANISAVSRVIANRAAEAEAPLRILDLCCYVGQWGTQLARVGQSMGRRFEVTLVDASQKALELAIANVEASGGAATGLKGDILDDLAKLPAGAFDVVICDPPAFIKKKKDVPQGQVAYAKVNREAMRKVAPGGVFFSSSCSGLLEEDEFRRVLSRAASQNKERDIRWVFRGSHSSDHPQRPEFPQGTYLKSWLALFMN